MPCQERTDLRRSGQVERNRALFVAAATTVVGVASTVGAAVYSGSGLLGFGSTFGASAAAADASPQSSATSVTPTTQAPLVVTQVQDEYDRFVINVPAPGSDEDPSTSDDPPPPLALLPAGASTTSSAPEPETGTAPAQDDDSADREDEAEDREDEAEEGGERDDDAATWSNSSAPPMPAGCVDGQLEDNGVWNCQH